MKKLTVLTPLVGIMLLLMAPLASATSIDLLPQAPSGGTQDVIVQVSGLPAGEIVSAFDMDVTFNSTQATATGVDFTNNLGVPTDLTTWLTSCAPGPCSPLNPEALTDVILSPGLVDFAEISNLSDAALQTLQSGLGSTFTLATLHFQLSPNITAGPGYAFNWAFPNDVKGLNAGIIFPQQNPIPEPSTVLLISSGLLGLVALRKRFSK